MQTWTAALFPGLQPSEPVFDPLEFLAEVAQHIPNPGEHLIRYYGFYSNKSRGLRAKGPAQATPSTSLNSVATPSAKEARKRWIRAGNFLVPTPPVGYRPSRREKANSYQ